MSTTNLPVVLYVGPPTAEETVIRVTLTAWGYPVTTLYPFDCARFLAQAPNLAVIDMRPADQSGFAAIKSLRQAGGHPPLACLTRASDIQRCRMVGCNDYLVPPITDVALRRIVQTHLAKP